MFCSECGAENNKGSNFCFQCGESLKIPTQTSQTQRTDKGRLLDTVTSYDDRFTEDQNGDWSDIKSKRTTTGILAIFFGWAGVHKFILGYNEEGLILLVVSIFGGLITCGFALLVTDIIGIIEGIIILTKTPQEFKSSYLDKKTAWF